MSPRTYLNDFYSNCNMSSSSQYIRCSWTLEIFISKGVCTKHHNKHTYNRLCSEAPSVKPQGASFLFYW